MTAPAPAVFDDVSFEQANTGVQFSNDATDQQAASSQEVVAMIDELTAVSQQTSAEAQNVSAATEERTAAITQIATNAESMSDRLKLDAIGGANAASATHTGSADATADSPDDASPMPADAETGGRTTTLVQSTDTGETVPTVTDVCDGPAADSGPDRLGPGDTALGG